jgi:predicted RNase H-like HicB family nuclease
MDTQHTENPVRSEIALFLQRWDEEMEAIQRALHGYAITARHDFISKRMQSFGDEKMGELMALEARKMNLQAKDKTMAKYRYLCVVEKGPENYGVYAPDLPGLGTVGDTPEEALRNMQEALSLHIEGLVRAGDPIPSATLVATDFVEVDV